MTRQLADQREAGPTAATGVLWLLAGCCAWLACSCASRPLDDYLIGPGGRPQNVYLAADRAPAAIRRVAVLPVVARPGDSALEAGREALQPVLYAELRKAGVFEVAEVPGELLRAWTGRSRWSAEETLPPDFLKLIQDRVGCDAVLFARLTHYRAYPPVAVGWSMKLVDAQTAGVFWAADEVFDAGNPSVSNAARHYYLGQIQQAGAPVDSRLVLDSPRRFGQFTVSQLAATLPGGGTISPKVPPQTADNGMEQRKP